MWATRRAFAPFGEMYNTVTGGTSNPDFTGDTQDTISGEFDTLFRELHPGQGRWISPDPGGLAVADPANPQSWNRYAYVVNGATALVDPLGLDCVYFNNGSPFVQPGDCLSSTDDGLYYDGSIQSITPSSTGVGWNVSYISSTGELGGGTAQDSDASDNVPSEGASTFGWLAYGVGPIDLKRMEHKLDKATPEGAANNQPQSFLQKLNNISVLSPNHCLGTASRTFARDMAIGEGRVARP